MHLLLAVSPLELPGGFTLFKLSPSLCLSEPFPAVGRVRCCAFSTQKLHGAAVCNVAHGVSLSWFLGGHCAPNKRKEKTAPLTFVEHGAGRMSGMISGRDIHSHLLVKSRVSAG
jgi:hypothetical protein